MIKYATNISFPCHFRSILPLHDSKVLFLPVKTFPKIISRVNLENSPCQPTVALYWSTIKGYLELVRIEALWVRLTSVPERRPTGKPIRPGTLCSRLNVQTCLVWDSSILNVAPCFSMHTRCRRALVNSFLVVLHWKFVHLFRWYFALKIAHLFLW